MDEKMLNRVTLKHYSTIGMKNNQSKMLSIGKTSGSTVAIEFVVKDRF
jgi:hypothetical protein